MKQFFLALSLPNRIASQCAHLIDELKSMRLTTHVSFKGVLPLTETFEAESSDKVHARFVKLGVQKGLRTVFAKTKPLEHDLTQNALFLPFEERELVSLGRYLLQDLRAGGVEGRVASPKIHLARMPSGYRRSMAIILAKECAPCHERVEFENLGIYSASTNECLHSFQLVA